MNYMRSSLGVLLMRNWKECHKLRGTVNYVERQGSPTLSLAFDHILPEPALAIFSEDSHEMY